jgi:heme/copper-type cytochrome/quinol oxidase subunit 4
MWHYLIKDGQELGPFSVDELRTRVAAGSVKKTDIVRREGESRHLPVAAILAAAKPDAEGLPPGRAVLENPPPEGLARRETFETTGASGASLDHPTRDNALAHNLSDFRALPLRAFFPIDALFHATLWNQFGVVWALVLAAIPLVLCCFSNQTERESLVMACAYFALVMALALFLFIRPEKPKLQRILLLATITSILVTCNQVLFNSIPANHRGLVFFILFARRLFACVLISLPFYFLYVRKRRVDGFRTIAYSGCLAGLACGLIWFIR